MPTLFISYKHGTRAIVPLMQKLRSAKYHLWFDRDDIHLGDPNWQAKVDQGLERCSALILALTPLACSSEPIQYEVKHAQELGKPVFPLVLESLLSIREGLLEIGLPPQQHVEDFTDDDHLEANFQKLVDDLIYQGIRVTRHDRRQQRGEQEHLLHQLYLTELIERIGRVQLSVVSPNQTNGALLEEIYLPLPTRLTLSVEIVDYRIVDWWLDDHANERGSIGPSKPSDYPPERRLRPASRGWEDAALASLVDQHQLALDTRKVSDKVSKLGKLRDGVYSGYIRLDAEDLAAICDRLVILGGPGSGKSTFVRCLALCLAGEQKDHFSRNANLTQLKRWPHGALTPIYVELRAFVLSSYFPPSLDELPTANHLWDYIREKILGAHLAAYVPDLDADLREGNAVLILDGLDEVPYPHGKNNLRRRQEQLRALAESLNDRYGGDCRIIVSSRPYAYDGWMLPGFSAIELAPFEHEHRLKLAVNLYREAGLPPDSAKEKAEQFVGELDSIDAELKDRPLFVTLMASIFEAGENFPTKKGELYRASILLLLERWAQQKTHIKPLTELLGNLSREDLLARLAALAYDVHDQRGDEVGTPNIPHELIYTHIFSIERDDESVRASELLSYLSENAGILVSPGQTAGQDVFHFAHRTFQEYLAAAHIAAHCLNDRSYASVRALLQSRPHLWRAPCALLGEILVGKVGHGELWRLIEDLLPDDPPNAIQVDDPRCWSVWLASHIVTDQALYMQRMGRSERVIHDHLVAWLVLLLRTAQALAPVERADCGRALGFLGDTRFGVGLKGGAIPDIDWVDVPAETFDMGSSPTRDRLASVDEIPTLRVELPAYRMSRFLITNAQFEAFLAAPLGYSRQDWWTVEGWASKKARAQTADPPNYPCVLVTWYEAVAFCRWLSAQIGITVRLPTEAEWERAARGADGRIYPYGDRFDPMKANVSETGIGKPCAVGIFPAGASAGGILDMSGNVSEWCLTKWRRSYSMAADNDSEGNAVRVVRGGAWNSNQGSARAAYRFQGHPDSAVDFRGFRIVTDAR